MTSHIMLSEESFSDQSPAVLHSALNCLSFQTAETKWQPVFLLPEVRQKHLFPSATHSFRRSRAEGCPFDGAGTFFKGEAFKSDSRCSLACPLDVADDTAISPHQDSHSLSFAVSPYMPSADIAVLLQ